MKLSLDSYVKAALVEAVDDKVRKQFASRIQQASSSSPFVPKDPEAIRKLVGIMVNIADVSPANGSPIHTAYVAWILQGYLAGVIQIKPGQENPDEDSMHEKLAIFDQVRKTKTEVPIKEWTNPEEQWNIKFYSSDDLNNLYLKVKDGDIEINKEGNTALDLDKFMAGEDSEEEQDRFLKRKIIERAIKRSTKHVYSKDGIEVYLIYGGPTVGMENLDAIRQGAFAWHTLGNGSSWCVAAGDMYSNTYGVSYLSKSDVLVCIKDKVPYFSLQYEGRLKLRNRADNDVLKSTLKELPLGEFTLIMIDDADLEKLTQTDHREVAEKMLEIYPGIDVSASVTFGNKQLVRTNNQGSKDLSPEVTKHIVSKIKSAGYASLKDYVLKVYPTIFALMMAKSYRLDYRAESQHLKQDIPGVSEYVLDSIIKSMMQTTGDAEYLYLFSMLFRYRRLMEEDILRKKSSNLAAIYMKILNNIIPKYPDLLQTEEFKDLDVEAQPESDNDY